MKSPLASRQGLWPAALLAMGAALALGCSSAGPPPPTSTSFRFEACGDLVPTYEKLLWQGPEVEWADRLLFRLALCYGEASAPTFDREKHRRTLQKLVWAHPGSELAGAARLLLALDDRRATLEDQLGRLESELVTRLEATRPVEAVSNAEVEALLERLRRCEQARKDSDSALRRAQEKREACERDVERLRNALDALIQVDAKKGTPP